MHASLERAASGFLEHAAWILERVEHRCASTTRDQDLVHQMRYAAQARQQRTPPRADGRQFDEHYDRCRNRYDIMTFLDDAFVSTFRMHVDSGEKAILPSLAEFGDALGPIVQAGCVVIDLSRMAANPDYAGKFPELPYFTIRAAWLAAEHFEADVIVSTCSSEHQAFYERVFGFETLCPPRASHRTGGKIACVALDYQAKKKRVENRHPFFRSTESERQSIFGPVRSLTAECRR